MRSKKKNKKEATRKPKWNTGMEDWIRLMFPITWLIASPNFWFPYTKTKFHADVEIIQNLKKKKLVIIKCQVKTPKNRNLIQNNKI